MKIPIRYKFFFTASLIAILVIGLSYWLGSRYLLRDKEAYAFETAAEAAYGQARKSAEYFESRFRTLEAARAIAGSETLSGDQKRDLIRALFSKAVDVQEITVRSPSGEDTLRLTFGGSAQARGACDRAAPGTAAGRVMARDARSGAITLGAVPDGVGAACMAVDASPIAVRGGLFELTLFRDDGQLLLAEAGSGDTAALWRLVAKRPVAVGSGTFTFEDEGGRAHLAAFASAPEIRAVAVAALPAEKVMGAVRALQKNLIIAAVLALVLAAVLSTVLAARMTRSIAVLEDASVRISKGDFDQEITLRTRDELEDLGDAINRMSRELRDRDQALRETHVKLVQAEKLAAFGQLGAGIAHEIKNPLTGMLGYVQLSQRMAGKEGKIGEYLKTVESEIMRCKGIIDDLLKFSRQDRGAKAPLTLPEVLANAVKLVRHQLMLMGVDIREAYDPATPQAWGNANQLQQVGINLILNAGQACGALKGDPKAPARKFCVTVSCRPEGNAAVIEVADNGTGIPPEAAAHVFEPFFTTKPEGQGTGLGLSVSYGIIREHQGEITFDTKPGEGTTFRIKLPAVQPPTTAGTA